MTTSTSSLFSSSLLFRGAALALALTLPVALTGCGDDPTDPSAESPPGTTGGTQDPATPPYKPPPPLELPEVAAVSAGEARAMLHSAAAELAANDVSRDLLSYLVEMGDRTGVNPIHEQLLAQSGGEYDEDFDSVGLGLEMLARYGEADIAPKILAAARTAIDEDDVWPATARSLAQVPGAEADALLVELTNPALELDEDGVAAAFEVCAERGVEGVRGHAAQTAASEDFEYVTRGAAIACLFKLGDPRASELITALLESEDTDFEDVVDGLGVRGLTAAVPPIRTALDQLLESDDATWVDEQACIAFRHIYADGGGEELVPFLSSLLANENASCEEEAQITLWMFGQDDLADGVGETLEAWVAGACAHANSDPENAVLILQELAKRGTALDPAFAKATNAATTAEAKPDAHPTQKERIRRLTLAAAYAILKSQPQ